MSLSLEHGHGVETPEVYPSPAAILTAALAASLITVAWRVLTFSGFNNDHYIYLAGAQAMLLGEWPVRDFVDPGWPLMYTVSAAARAMFGRALGVELMVVSSAFAIGAAFTFATASRLSKSLVIATIVTLFEIAMSPRSFGYPKIALYAVAAWMFVVWADHLTTRRIVMLAAFTVVAFLFRHDHGLYIGAGSLALVVLASWQDGLKVLVLRIGVFVGALAVLLMPWALYVQHYVGLVGYFQPGLEFSRAEAEGTVLRALPRFGFGGPLFGQANLEVWLFYVFETIPFACLVTLWFRLWRGQHRWSAESAAVTAVSVMAIAMNLGFLRTPLAARLPDAVVPAAVLGSWLLGLAWRRRGSRARLAWAVSAFVLASSAWAIVVVADVRNELNTAGILNRPGAMKERIADLRVRLSKPMPERDHLPSRNSQALMPFYAYVDRCSAPTDRLVMTGLSPDVFVLANRGFAGGQMAFRPSFYTSPTDQQRALTRLRAQSVPFVIVALEEEADFLRAMPAIASYVDTHYDKLALVPVPDTRGLQLYVERGRHPAGVDGATGWPCFVAR
ncbi:MAG TPA: hypothetical protein VKB50_06110 [Vicinamibacterales bacterium]|nr:hypothetical protein [Vicinamibacterales bacterium]